MTTDLNKRDADGSGFELTHQRLADVLDELMWYDEHKDICILSCFQDIWHSYLGEGKGTSNYAVKTKSIHQMQVTEESERQWCSWGKGGGDY